MERRRVRRERNKLAAAKCRNRRRELTETLQCVSERYTNVTTAMLEIHGIGLKRELTFMSVFLCFPLV